VNGDNHWVEVELEVNTGDSLIVFQLPGVVSYTVLVCLERPTSGGNICSRNHMQEVLVRHERCGR
jgi:hypothetical protein